jgi:hypothetical protein
MAALQHPAEQPASGTAACQLGSRHHAVEDENSEEQAGHHPEDT